MAIAGGQVTIKNTNSLFTNYKAISSDKPLQKKLTKGQLQPLLESIPDDEEDFDLLAMRLAFGSEYPPIINGRRDPDTTSAVLQQTDDDTVKRLVLLIEYYADYDDLLLLVIDWKQPLLIAILDELTLHSYGTSKISITSILPHFESIKNRLNVSEECILKRLDPWSTYAEQEITEENIEEIILDTSFYESSTTYKLKLTKHINKIAKNFINNYEKENILEEWGNDGSYLFNTLFIFMKKKEIQALPQNIFSACKDVFLGLANGSISIPKENTMWSLFLAKSHKKELIPTIKNIRDGFIKSGNVTPELFLYFSELFEEYGDLKNKSEDVSRTILAKVIQNGDCLSHILSKTEFYTKIINVAGDDAADLKERIQEKISDDPENKNLAKFAKKIGAKSDDGN